MTTPCLKWTDKTDGTMTAENFVIRPIAGKMRLIQHVRIVRTHKDRKGKKVETVEKFDLQTDFGGFEALERAKKLANRNRIKEESK